MGKGEVSLGVSPLKQPLKPVEMLDQGNIVEVSGFSFVAGTLPMKVSGRRLYRIRTLISVFFFVYPYFSSLSLCI